MELDVAIIAAFVVVFGTASGRLRSTIITAPMVFVVFGLIVGPEALDLVELDLEGEGLGILAKATLVLVLFSDASRIDLRVLRQEYQLPGRLLGIGLPLTIVAGTAVALALFAEFSVGEAALVAAILAPTDAALGQLVVTSKSVPLRIRQALNVESGLNDGIALPVITIFVALAGAESDVESASFWLEFAAKQIGYGALVGAAVGAVGGLVIDRAALRGWMDGVFRQLATLAVAVAAFAFASAVDGNGFIAAFVAGAALGFVTPRRCEDVLDFTEDEGQLLTLLTFLLFGSSIALPALDQLTWEIGVYVALSLTLVRMVPVAISMIGSGLRRESVLFLGWFGPRGLASILFGLEVLEEELPRGDDVFLIVTWTVLVSVVAHGVSVLPGAMAYSRRHEAMAEGHPDMPEAMSTPEHPTRW